MVRPKIFVRSRRGDFGIFHDFNPGATGNYQSDVLLRFSGEINQTVRIRLRSHVGHLYRAHQRRLPPAHRVFGDPAGISVDGEYYSTSIDLSWPATLGADGYRLQRRLVDADYEEIANVDEASSRI